MNVNVKKLINPIIFLASGLLGLIFMALDYIGITDGDEFEGLENGYGFIGWDVDGADVAFFKVLSSIALVFAIIGCIALIIIGAVKLISALGYDLVFLPGKIVDLVANITTLVYMILHCSAFFFLFIFGLANSNSWFTFIPGVGAFFLLIFSIGLFVATKIIAKKFDTETVDQPRIVYVCSACNKKCRANDKFCGACGNPVVKKEILPVVFVCSACGKTATSKDKFCSACGGQITAQTVVNNTTPTNTGV